MRRRRLLLRIGLALGLGFTLPAARAQQGGADAPAPHRHGQAAGKGDLRGAPLFAGLGDHHHPVTTSSPLAQRYFDQGLTLLYAFNHEEAIRSFRAAAALDPGCAMAYWGIAYAYGPNINRPMEKEHVAPAYRALKQAQAAAPRVSARERAYIAALAKRYSPRPVADRSALDRAYARAMGEVARRYPDDLDAAVLYAEALLDTMPWDYWTKDMRPKPATRTVLRTLESVMARAPDHPGANHYYIHAVEAGPNPEAGLAAADRLRDLVPAAGHLVHMPGHIYLRVGRYDEAARANELAIRADREYLAPSGMEGSFYARMYATHNYAFYSYTTMMAGRRADSLRAARTLAADAADDPMAMAGIFRVQPLLVMERFGMYEEILRQEPPPADRLYDRGVWHYGRGMAYAATGRPTAARREAAQLARIAADEATEAFEEPGFYGRSQLRIADRVLAGAIARAERRPQEAARALRAAVVLQDNLPYMEPPYWYFPVRHLLGAVLLEADRPAAAERVYREDLERNPANGWSLFGLAQSLEAQGRTEAAAATRDAFEQAWLRADVTLRDSSRAQPATRVARRAPGPR